MIQIDYGPEIVIGAVVLLLALRWAHRCWGKAVIGTVFAPLIIVPLWFFCYIAFSLIMRGLNWILSGLDLGLSVDVLSTITSILTGIVLLWLGVIYCREQRSTPGSMKGPWLGTRYRVGEPRINQRGPFR